MRIRGVRGIPAAVIVFLTVGSACGEWVQVPVIDRGLDNKRQQQPQPPLFTPPQATSPHPSHLETGGVPGPSSDDVMTIRRTVGDSFSNKEGVVVDSVDPQTPRTPQGPGGDKDSADADDAYVQVEDEADWQPEAPEAPESAEEEGLPLQELREAHQTLLRQSTAPVSGKLDFLRRLKNRLLRHIASLAPLSALSLAGVRATRTNGAHDGVAAEGRGHKGVGFPSNEGTLMSLAFLVFAVFLVKVVMQLIYAVQNSQVNNNPGVRVAQMQIPGGMMPSAMNTMMNMVPTMMNMVPAMPPMMAAMDPNMARARRAADRVLDRAASRVLDAIEKTRMQLSDRRANAAEPPLE